MKQKFIFHTKVSDSDYEKIRSVPDPEPIYEILFDTYPKYTLIPQNIFLWKIDNTKWRLEIFTETHSMFETEDESELDHQMQGILQDTEWKTQLCSVVCFKTTRFELSKTEWIDFACWSRWKTGNYAVKTTSTEDQVVDNDDEDVVPSKMIACLHHIMPLNFKEMKMKFEYDDEFLSKAVITEEAIRGPGINLLCFTDSDVDSYVYSDSEDNE
jgi:hypothetical protein